MQRSYFGIDFGTTNTAVVQMIVEEGLGSKIVNCSEDDLPFPSLLAVNKNDGTVLFGRQVKMRKQQLSNEYHIFSSFKSLLGKEKILIGDLEFSPIDITAKFLRCIKDYVKSRLELDISCATFAIPVDFLPEQRRDLKLAAKLAGIEVNRFISESTAAYMRNIEYVEGLSKVAVFDWGGGTLDISILEIDKNFLNELAIYGIKLGGDDIDRQLARKLHADIASRQHIGDFDDMSPKDRDTMIARCEEAKIILSEEDYRRIQLIDYAGIGVITIPLEYDRFKELIQIDTEKAISALYEALKKAQLSPAQLDAIIMVGGSSEMRPIQELVSELFERKNIKVVYPEKKQWSVAVGAAMLETSRTRYKLKNAIGVILSDDSFYPVIRRDSPVPCAIDHLEFGVVEETTDAHFIFADENMNVMSLQSVPIKGFSTEAVKLSAYIDDDMIANITLKSNYLGQVHRNVALNKLSFYYDLDEIQNPCNLDQAKIDFEKSEAVRNQCSFPGCQETAVFGTYCNFHNSYENYESK